LQKSQNEKPIGIACKMLPRKLDMDIKRTDTKYKKKREEEENAKGIKEETRSANEKLYPERERVTFARNRVA